MATLFSQLDWVAFLIAMMMVELTPGPNMGWLAALSARYGRRVGLMAVAGVTLGLAVQVIAAATGFSTLIAGSPLAYNIVRWAGVAFMGWLAWEAYSDVGSASPVKGLESKGFKRGLIANLLNPKAFVFYVVIVGQFVDTTEGGIWRQVLALGAIHLCIAIVVHICIVLLGARLGETLERWRTSIATRLVFSGFLIGIAIWIAISTGQSR